MGLDQGQNPLQGQAKAAGGGLTIAWAEFISKQGWAGDASFRPGETRIVRHLIIHFTNIQTAIREIIGYSFKSIANGRLSRVLPMRDPQFDWCYASAITGIRGIKFTGKNTNGTAGPYADYQYAIITVLFTSPNYEIKTDAQVTVAGGFYYEWQRFTEKNLLMTTESLTIPEGSLVWGSNHPTLAGKKLTQQTNWFQTKYHLSMKWLQVPDNGLFSGGGFESGGRPTKIEGVVNRLNNGVFPGANGYPLGALLCYPPVFEPFVYPAPAHVLNLGPDTLVPRCWNVTFNLVAYLVDPIGAGETSIGGWNKAPATTGTWYSVERPGGGYSIYKTANYDNLFSLVA